jgi:hypothetical protein
MTQDYGKAADAADAQIPLEVSTRLGDAIWTWQMFGQTDDIAGVLLSGDDLSQADREWLADYVQGKIRLPRRKPPLAHLLQAHKTLAVTAAANEVRRLISEWTAAGQKRPGLNAKAIDAAAAKFCPAGIANDDFREKLDTFVRRSKRQRKSPAGHPAVLVTNADPRSLEAYEVSESAIVVCLLGNGRIITVPACDLAAFGRLLFRTDYLRDRNRKSAP